MTDILDWIADKVSEDQPAGPDLLEEGNDDFDEVVYDAELPEEFFERPPESVVDGETPSIMLFPDQTKFDPAKLIGPIDALLKISRDMRLMSLRFQYATLAGDLALACETLEATNALFGAMNNDVHPKDGGVEDRLEALRDMTSQQTVILPLSTVTLAGTDASVRRIKVAKGESNPFRLSVLEKDKEGRVIARLVFNEADLQFDYLQRELSTVIAGETPPKEIDLLDRMLAALDGIFGHCASHATPHTPDFSGLKKMLTEMKSLLLSDAEVAESEEEAAPMTGAASGVSGGGSAVSTGKVNVISHDHARRLLAACEVYYLKNQPSSAVLPLVTQARQIIGMTMIEVIKTLMPNRADDLTMPLLGEDMDLKTHHLDTLADTVREAESLIDGYVQRPEPEPEPYVEPEPEPEPEPEEAESSDENPSEEEDGVERSDDESTASEEEEAEAEETEAEDDSENDAAEPEPEVIAEPDPQPVMRQAPPQPDPEQEELRDVETVQQATAYISAVEAYFSRTEPSSPVPILLSKARNFVGKSFDVLVKEIIPKQDY